jgi:hypothetical protein
MDNFSEFVIPIVLFPLSISYIITTMKVIHGSASKLDEEYAINLLVNFCTTAYIVVCAFFLFAKISVPLYLVVASFVFIYMCMLLDVVRDSITKRGVNAKQKFVSNFFVQFLIILILVLGTITIVMNAVRLWAYQIIV